MLIHVGYHKTASSWLQRHVFGNPRTGLGTVGKEGADHPVRQFVAARPLEFDPAASRAQFEPLLQEVRAKGRMPVVSWERLAGSPYSGGHDSKELANRLIEVFPEGRILVVIREQRAMIASTYKMYVLSGGPGTLARFLAPPSTRKMYGPSPDLRHFEYEHLLRHYQALFGPEAVLTLAYEQFVHEPAAFVAAIGRVAGQPIPEDVLASMPFDRVRRPSLSAFEIEVRRRLNRLTYTELNPAPKTDSQRVKDLTKLVVRTTTRMLPERVARASDASLRRAVDESVGDRYVQSNRATAELTGIDLARYGWVI